MIFCVPLNILSLVHLCSGCGRTTPFDSNWHCWFCGCDPPSGVPSDNEEDRDGWADHIYRYQMDTKGVVTMEYAYHANDHPPESTPTERELGIVINKPK